VQPVVCTSATSKPLAFQIGGMANFAIMVVGLSPAVIAIVLPFAVKAVVVSAIVVAVLPVFLMMLTLVWVVVMPMSIPVLVQVLLWVAMVAVIALSVISVSGVGIMTAAVTVVGLRNRTHPECRKAKS
jgi:hypothetical protein